MSDQTDKMSGKTFYEANAVSTADDGSVFQLSASCTPGFSALRVTIKGDKKLAQTSPNSVSMRLRFDDSTDKLATGMIDGTNSAVILLHDKNFASELLSHGAPLPEPYAKQLQVAGLGGAQNVTAGNQGNPASGMMSGFVNGVVSSVVYQTIVAANPGTTQQLFSSDSLKIEIPLDNGKKPIVTVSLNSGDFSKFVERCTADEEKVFNDAERERYAALKNTVTVSGYFKKLNSALKDQGADLALYKPALDNLGEFLRSCATQADTINDQHLNADQAAQVSRGNDCHVLPVAITKEGIKRPIFLYAGVMWDDKRTAVHFKVLTAITDPKEPEPTKYPVMVNTLKNKVVTLVDSENVVAD